MVALLPCFLSPPSLLLCRRSKPILCLSSREVVRRPPLRLRAAPSGIGRPCLRVSALDPNHLFDIAVGVGLPCSVQGCGDVIYRSTLDPVLRMEEKVGITTQGASLIAAVLLYLYVDDGQVVDAQCMQGQAQRVFWEMTALAGWALDPEKSQAMGPSARLLGNDVELTVEGIVWRLATDKAQ